MDRAGNFYGTAQRADIPEATALGAVVFKLTHIDSAWVLTPLYDFQGGNDGTFPRARVIIGPNGSLYGTTIQEAPLRLARLRHGFQPETPSDSLQDRTLPLDGNHALSLHGRQ